MALVLHVSVILATSLSLIFTSESISSANSAMELRPPFRHGGYDDDLYSVAASPALVPSDETDEVNDATRSRLLLSCLGFMFRVNET